MIILSIIEYVAASEVARETIWFRKLMNDLRCQCQRATSIYVDNQSAIRLIWNPEFHKKTKYIDIRHYIHEKIESHEINIEFVLSEEQKTHSYKDAI